MVWLGFARLSVPVVVVGAGCAMRVLGRLYTLPYNVGPGRALVRVVCALCVPCVTVVSSARCPIACVPDRTGVCVCVSPMTGEENSSISHVHRPHAIRRGSRQTHALPTAPALHPSHPPALPPTPQVADANSELNEAAAAATHIWFRLV